MKNVDSRMFDHLGLEAGCYDEFGIADIVDDLLPQLRVHKIGHRVIVKGMILNGLGFVDRPLYMTPEFFNKVSCNHLLGQGVDPGFLNDDSLGKTLDCIYLYGGDRVVQRDHSRRCDEEIGFAYSSFTFG